jgi:hypothetical protein
MMWYFRNIGSYLIQISLFLAVSMSYMKNLEQEKNILLFILFIRIE